MTSSSESIPEASAAPSFTRRNYPGSKRYFVCLLLLVSQGIAQLLAILCYETQQLLLCFIAQCFITFLGAFTMQWCQIYSSGLTRARRAFFDEINILQTYQPRARTMGHLFMPEPPTPVPGMHQQDQQADQKALERNIFTHMRDAHYANEYNFMMKVNREMNEKESLGEQHGQALNFGCDNATIEGPVLIEFHAEEEEDDEDYMI